MNVQRTRKPSPPAGEGGRELAGRRKAPPADERPGEGVFLNLSPSDRANTPSPASRRSRSAPSPARGEGNEPAVPESVPSTSTTQRARELRGRMTDAERKLWFALRDRRFANFKFRRQVPVGPFIADFICYGARVVIEVDGGQHADSKSDERRDQWFASNKFFVLRFWNHDVLLNLEGVLTVILETLRERTIRLP